MQIKRRILAVLLLVLAAVLPAGTALAGETPWGLAPVYGYKDLHKSELRKFAPYAVMPGIPHVKGYHLKYAYQKFAQNNRVWQVALVDDEGKAKSYPGRDLRIVFPYPSLWSDEYGAYWKWTKYYAGGYKWYYSIGDSSFYYLFGTVTDWTAGYFDGTPYKPVHKMRDYGVEVRFSKPFLGCSVLIHFEDRSQVKKGPVHIIVDTRSSDEKKLKPFSELFE